MREIRSMFKKFIVLITLWAFLFSNVGFAFGGDLGERDSLRGRAFAEKKGTEIQIGSNLTEAQAEELRSFVIGQIMAGAKDPRIIIPRLLDELSKKGWAVVLSDKSIGAKALWSALLGLYGRFDRDHNFNLTLKDINSLLAIQYQGEAVYPTDPNFKLNEHEKALLMLIGNRAVQIIAIAQEERYYDKLDPNKRSLMDNLVTDQTAKNILAGFMLGKIQREDAINALIQHLRMPDAGIAEAWVRQASAPTMMANAGAIEKTNDAETALNELRDKLKAVLNQRSANRKIDDFRKNFMDWNRKLREVLGRLGVLENPAIKRLLPNTRTDSALIALLDAKLAKPNKGGALVDRYVNEMLHLITSTLEEIERNRQARQHLSIEEAGQFRTIVRQTLSGNVGGVDSLDVMDIAPDIIRQINPQAEELERGLTLLEMTLLGYPKPMTADDLSALIKNSELQLNQHEISVLNMIVNPSQIGGIAISADGVLPHRGEGYVNDCIVKVLEECVKKGRLGLSGRDTFNFIKFLEKRKPGEDIPEEARLSLKRLAYTEKGFGISEGKEFRVVKLPVDKLGKVKELDEVKGQPFTAHIGLRQGVIWVAVGTRNAPRSAAEVEADILHEIAEYNLALDETRARGWTMEELVKWRDEGSPDAQYIFQEHHLRAWVKVRMICLYNVSKAKELEDRKKYEAMARLAGDRLKKAESVLEAFQLSSVVKEGGVGITSSSEATRAAEIEQRKRYLSAESLRDLEENTSGEPIETVFVGLMCVDKIHSSANLIKDMVPGSLSLGGDIAGSIDPKGDKTRTYLSSLPAGVQKELSDMEGFISGGPASSAARVGCQISRPKDGGRTQTSFVTSVGEDGRIFVERHQALGIDMSAVHISSNPTATTLVFEMGEGKRSFLHNVGASAELTIGMLKPEYFKGKKVAEFGGIELTGLMSDLDEALRRAKEARCIIVLDTVVDKPRQWKAVREKTDPETGQKYGSEYLKRILQYVDVFTPSWEEALQIMADALFPEDEKAADAYIKATEEKLKQNPEQIVQLEKELVDFFVSHGARAVFLKVGKEGVYVKTTEKSVFKEETEFHVPILRGFKEVSGTGTGDAFCGAVVYALAHNWDVRKTAMFGNVVGGMCVQYKGGTIGDEMLVDALYHMERLRLQMRATTTTPKTILVVEDDAGVAGVLKAFLEMQGYRVKVVSSAREGVNLLGSQPFNAVITDLGLEEGKDAGKEVLRKAKEKGVPAVLITGRLGALTKAEQSDLKTLGASEIFGKPLRLQELKDTLQRLSTTTPAAGPIAGTMGKEDIGLLLSSI